MEEQANTSTQGMAPVPNATAVLVLGILSIVGCWVLGILGLVLGIIALVLGGKGRKYYNEAPQKYSLASYRNLSAGRVCAIIGISLSGLWLLIFIVLPLLISGAALSALGGSFFTFPWESLPQGF
jgi:hypothetical protein